MNANGRGQRGVVVEERKEGVCVREGQTHSNTQPFLSPSAMKNEKAKE